jgi:hypothetical protein
VVKIDNVEAARPQTGINEADVVIEEQVEGGQTRLAALFHSTPADPVGPIRSARSTDINLLAPLYHPLFAYSGANRDFKKLVRESSMIDVGVENFPDKYFRDTKGRSKVHSLFSNTSALHSLAAPDAQAPPPLFSYRAAGTRPSEPEARPVSRVSANWTYHGRGTGVSYDWDTAAGAWTRIMNGSLHVDSAGRKVAPTNVIIQFVTYHDTGYRDSSNTEVPEADVIGSGDGWFLSAGYLAPVRWEKRDKDEVTVFRGKDGRYARLLPGRTWLELVPIGQGNATDRPADGTDAARPMAPPAPDGSVPTPGPTTSTTGPEASTTTTAPPEATTTTVPTPVSTVTTLPVPPIDSSTTTSSSSSTTTAKQKQSPGKKQSALPPSSPARASSAVATGPATAAVFGLLLLFAPLPHGRRRRSRHQR